MKSRILSLCLLAIVGCDSKTMEQTATVPQTTIAWVRETPTECGGEPQHYGCSRWTADRKLCQITMPENASNDVIAHEFRHCFGYSHVGAER